MQAIMRINRNLKAPRLSRYLAVLCIVNAAACSDIPPMGIIEDTSSILSRIELKDYAIALKEGDTYSIDINAYTAAGEVPVERENLSFLSSTPSRVDVSNSGQVTALFSTDQPAVVRVGYKRGDITLYDTVRVMVTDTAAVASSLSVSLADSSIMPLYLSVPLRIAVLNPNGDTIKNVPIRLWTENPATLTISGTSNLSGRSVGKSWVYATTTAYGTKLSDSVEVTVKHAIQVSTIYWTGQWGGLGTGTGGIIQKGGTFRWTNTWNAANGDLVNVEFDNPSAVSPDPNNVADGGGNIPFFRQGNRIRQFNVPGTYRWTSKTENGTLKGGGVIVVMPSD